MIHEILRQLALDNWTPSYIVGLSRGGLIPGVKISHYLKAPFYSLQVSLRDGGETETNCAMAEDAIGYVRYEDRKLTKSRWDIKMRKNILIVDDINDSGATFNWIKEDWKSTCLPNEADAWNSIWNKNVRFAALINNEASDFAVDYSAININKIENDQWIEFPWENWWSGE